jgi:hypothetical protein
MNREQFIENLQLYGSDMNTWPEEIREHALTGYRDSAELRGLVEKEKQFESMLTERSIDEPTSDFERRITLSAKSKVAIGEKASVINSIFDLISIPKPALTMAMLLLFGFSLGFFYDTYTYTDDNTLELSEYISFDEGEYYE